MSVSSEFFFPVKFDVILKIWIYYYFSDRINSIIFLNFFLPVFIYFHFSKCTESTDR